MNSIGFDRVLMPLDEADPSFFGGRFKAAEPPCKDKSVGAVQEGCFFGALARGSGWLGHDELSLLGGGGLRGEGGACAGLLSGWVAPAVVLDIFGALSLAWVKLVVLNDPPS
jgi:hypothetical protein